MLNIKTMLDERKIPDALVTQAEKNVKTAAQFEFRRDEIKKILEEEIYGELPKKPDHLRVETISSDKDFCAGKADFIKLKFICTFGNEEAAFPVCAVIPKSNNPCPAFVMINSSPAVPDKYLPAEEIADRGFAVFSFDYTDIATDDKDFKKGLAKYLVPTRRKKSASGKLILWAWASIRVMDYIQKIDAIDKENIAVIGHCALGTSAMLAGGFDERFKYIISNESGTLGAALSRGKTGESPKFTAKTAPHLFCPRFPEKTNDENEMPFDQNFLSVLSVPRHLMVGSCSEDIMSDPESEFLGCASANAAYALYGMCGLIYGDEIPVAKTILSDGDALYHIRHGLRYLSREDWNVYMDYIEKVMKK